MSRTAFRQGPRPGRAPLERLRQAWFGRGRAGHGIPKIFPARRRSEQRPQPLEHLGEVRVAENRGRKAAPYRHTWSATVSKTAGRIYSRDTESQRTRQSSLARSGFLSTGQDREPLQLLEDSGECSHPIASGESACSLAAPVVSSTASRTAESGPALRPADASRRPYWPHRPLELVRRWPRSPATGLLAREVSRPSFLFS